MSVSRGGEDAVELADAFDELERTFVRRAFTYDASENSGNSPNLNAAAYNSIPPAGGIDRGEVAELVAIIHNHAFVEQIGGNFGTEPGRVKGLYFLSTNSTDFLVGPGSDDFITSKSDIDPNDAGNHQGFNVSEWTVTGPIANSIAYYAEVAGTLGFNDTVNGTGGGASTGAGLHPIQYINYRKMYGLGPLYEHDQLLHEHPQLNLDNAPNQDTSFEVGYQLVWDVHEMTDQLDVVGELQDRIVRGL